MQQMNSQITEQDQQRFSKQLQDNNDEIGVRSDDEEEEDEEDDSDDDE
jgi:hypothetical protein